MWVCRGGVYAARILPATAHFPRAACRPPLHPTRKPATPAQRHGGVKAPALRVTGNLRPLVGWVLDPTAGDRRLLWVCRGGVYAARQYPGHPTFPRAACRPPLHPPQKPTIPAQRHGGAKAPALRVTGNLRLLVGWGLDPTAGKRRFLAISDSFFSKSSCILVAKCYNYKRRFVIFFP